MASANVSVCIPVRNQAGFLGEALESALAQDVDGLELVVHDDASTDETQAVVAAVADPRLRYLRHRRPLGVARNRDSCLAAARGRYVAWLDGDDAYLPGALVRQLSVLERNPGVGLVHGGVELVDEHGRRLRDWPAPFDADAVETSAVAFSHLIASNELTTSTVLVRRSAHDAAGPFGRAARASSSDWAMWLRIALRSDVAYSAARVARYRQHAASISSATSGSGERLRCDVAVVRDLLASERSRLSDPGRAAAVASAALAAKALLHAGDLLARGRRGEATRAVGLAARVAPRPLAGLAPRLLAAIARGDGLACHRTSKAMLARLAAVLEGTRYGAKLRAAATVDPGWQAVLERAAGAVRRVVPADACVGTVTKWDPTLLALSGRRGRNFPDRRRLPEGYPRDDAAAVEHLEQLRGEGLSHLVLPSASFWWLDHYPALAAHLRDRAVRLWSDSDCLIYELGAAA